jgi:hypothetical protein
VFKTRISEVDNILVFCNMIFKNNYIIKYLLSVIVVYITSCMPTYTLQNGRTKVPTKPAIYKNQAKFDKTLLKIVDTGVVYEEFNKRYNVLTRLDNHIETRIYAVYRFYPNGRFNIFFIDRDKPLNINEFNPHYQGYRGVFYSEKNQIRYDLFAESNGLGWIGKLSGTFYFNGDTLYIKRDEASKEFDIYIKKELPSGYLNYKAVW